ncbi:MULTISPECIES: hypothetical protein [unclassified Streptomyces]|uniref:hypothetical protein n=1 Tax=unclassified Streptomyces TaxID=2593676 RepID=UPI003D75D302
MQLGECRAHPLTLVRATLRRIAPTVTLDERSKGLPPCGEGGPPRPEDPRLGWLRRDGR